MTKIEVAPSQASARTRTKKSSSKRLNRRRATSGYEAISRDGFSNICAGSRTARLTASFSITPSVSRPIVLAALVPALVALNLGTVGRTITVVLGVIVAAATAVEHFLTSGQRWRHYRGSVELMKSEGWLYLESAGPYANLSLEAAFPTFVGRVETLMRDEVNEYVTIISTTREGTGDQPVQPAQN
jgi:Protein of unknown function (DUF4231)